jgi:hypothetical protein
MQASMSARCAPRAATATAARISPPAIRQNVVSASLTAAARRPKLFAAAVEADTTAAPEPTAPVAAPVAAPVEASTAVEEEVVVITEAGRLANAEPSGERRRGGGGRGGGRGGRGRRTPTLKTEDIVAGLQVEGKVVRLDSLLRHRLWRRGSVGGSERGAREEGKRWRLEMGREGGKKIIG